MRKCPKCKREFASNERVCPDDGSILDDGVSEEDRVIGMTLDGKYKIEGFVKRGGMGAVYRGTHLMLGKPVAIKLIKPELVSSKEIVERFLREARSAAQLAHPNIVTVHDLGQTGDGTLYIAMELVDGRSLKEIIVKEGPWEPDRAVKLAKGIARALALAHRRGVIHRDLKPQNIMVSVDADGNEVPKLLDFGIARTLEPDTPALTSTGMVLGTPHYMSSEQAKGLPADARSDLYALGIILYEMLVGKVPFEDKSIPSLLVKHMSAPPPRPTTVRSEVPQWLETVVLRCLEKEPADRFASAEELIDVLDSQKSAPTGATPVAPAAGVLEETVEQPMSAPDAQHTGAGGSVAAFPGPAPPQTVPPAPPASPPSTSAESGTGAPATIRKRELPPAAGTSTPPSIPVPPPAPGSVAPTPASVQPQKQTPRQYSSGSKAGVILALGTVVLLLAVVGFALFRSFGSPDGSESEDGALVASAAPGTGSEAGSPTSVDASGADQSGAGSGATGGGATSGTGGGGGGGTGSSGSSGGASTGGTAGVALVPPSEDSAPVEEPRAEASSRGTSTGATTRSEPANERGRAAARRKAARQRAAAAQAPEPPAEPPMPERPPVYLSCDGVRDGCAALRFTIQETFQKNNLPIVPEGRAEILVSLEVEEVEARSEQNFGTTFIMRTYSMSASGEVPRFGEFLSLPPRVFTFDARVGRERLREQSRLVASDLARRIDEFWERKK